ncbi:hypothetical protein [Piscinibacter koreensis]|uniref:Uncharacterized protein n=1 Tax=Piscinibacter koreensis TaxID=2742824 RepID=A0A7Y6NSF3_9BURK|nr:hypothetical protein [Schlegelella koreensis]NUZ08485.1 hypothetical protein [Schlegelella koreensis]
MGRDIRIDGDYQIHALAIPASDRAGFVAAVKIKRIRGIPNAPQDAFEKERLAGGFVWPTAEAARLYAIAKAEDVIRQEPFRLRC